jgi:hypothetical protein
MAGRQDVSPSAPSSAEGANGPAPGAVEALIERFGGLRPMAEKLGVPVSTVQGWKKRGAIPGTRQSDIRAAIERLGLAEAGDFDGAFRHEEAAAPVESPAAPAVIESVAASAVIESPAAPVAVEPEPPAVEPVPVQPVPVEPVPVEPVPVQPVPVEPVPVEPVPVEPVPVESAPVEPPAPVEISPPIAPVVPLQETPVTEVQQNPAPAAAEDRSPAQQGSGQGSSGQGAGAAIAAAILAVVGAAVSVTAPLWSHEYLQRAVNITGIEERTAKIETAFNASAAQRAQLTDRVAGLEKTLAALESKVAKGPAVAGALVARDLRASLSSGAPFALEAAAAKAAGLIGADEAASAATLAPYTEKGVPTAAALNERFAWTASTTMVGELPGRVWNWASGVAGGVAGAAGSVAGSVNVSGLAAALRLKEPEQRGAAQAAVPAAPVEPVAAPPAPVAPVNGASAALMAEAGGLLRAGDLPAAVEVVAKLEGPAGEAVAGWLADARARVAADKLAAAVSAKAAAALR